MGRITKHADVDFEPFVLDDGTGTAYVDPANADVILTEDDEFEVEKREEPPAFIREFLERETEVKPVGRYKRWYREYRLAVDREARVAGQADPAAVPDLVEPTTTGVVEAGDAPKFIVTDDPDLTLGKRMLQEAFLYCLVAAICFGVAYWLLFVN